MKATNCITKLLFSYLFIVGVAIGAFAQSFDISSGGQPTIAGALNGSVTGSADVRQNLVVRIDFGELSPANLNNIVKVTVPIAIRSTLPYQVRASITGIVNINLQALQPFDIGFGVVNMRRLGALAQNCANHTIQTPFNNDPASTVGTGANGRAVYPSSLLNITNSTVVLSGPTLSKGLATRRDDNGYVFDAVFAIKPQFYAPGIASGIVTFTIESGPIVACN